MSATNCPNCGAPRDGAVCEYCGTHFARYQGEATVTVETDGVTVYSWDGQDVLHVPGNVRTNIEVNVPEPYGTVERR